jgi:hypothetical protein
MRANQPVADSEVGPSVGSGVGGGVTVGLALLSMLLSPSLRQQLGQARHRPAAGELAQHVLQVVPGIDSSHQTVATLVTGLQGSFPACAGNGPSSRP